MSQINWKPMGEFDSDRGDDVLIKGKDGSIHTVYYMIWNEGDGEDEEYRCWRDDTDNNYDFEDYPEWAEIGS